MGYKLSNEVLDNAPDDLTPAERLVLSVLAGYVQNEATRECYPGLKNLVKRTGLKPDSLRRVFQRLDARGLDPRVPIGIDKKGRKVFAHENVQTKYRIPRFKSRDEHPATEEGPESRHSARGGTTGPQRRDESASEGGPASRPKGFEGSEEDLSPEASEPDAPASGAAAERETEAAPEKTTTAQRTVRASGVVAVADEDAFIAWVRAKYPPAGATFWERVAENDDVPSLAVAWRADQPMRHSAPTAPLAATCWTCTRPALKPVVAFGRTYCPSCCEPCSGCRAATPADLLDMDTNRCSACRAPFAAA